MDIAPPGAVDLLALGLRFKGSGLGFWVLGFWV